MTRILTVFCLAGMLPLAVGCTALPKFLGGQAAAGGSLPAMKGNEVSAAVDAAPETMPRELYLKLVQGLETQGKNHAALAYLDDYSAKYRDDPPALLLRARALLAVARPDEAATVYRKLLATQLQPAARDGLGQVAALRGDWPAARASFHVAAGLSPTDAHVLNNYGFALIKSAAFADAEFTLRQAVELAPENDEIRDNLILCLHLEGKSAEAESMIEAKPLEKRRSIEAALAAWAPPTAAAPSQFRQKEASRQ